MVTEWNIWNLYALIKDIEHINQFKKDMKNLQ